MKLAFSTLGCPAWDLKTVISRAAEYGFDGIDFRGLGDEMEIFKLPAFASQAEQTRRRIEQAGLEVPCFSSSVRLIGADQKMFEELKSYAGLCRTFDAPYIRVFGGSISEMPRTEAIDQAAATLVEMAAVAEDHGVTLLVETHDSWLKGEHLRAVMERADCQAAGVVWDVHHPVRRAGESPAETWRNLGPWIRNTHWKDSLPDPAAGHQLCLMGEGDIPLTEIRDVLLAGGYDGYLTLEWEKRWHEELPDPEVAFPQYVRFMRDLFAGRGL